MPDRAEGTTLRSQSLSSVMRIAAIYDIHGNLPALEAVLRDIRRESVDLVLVGGDVVPGPMPHESISCLLDLDLQLQCIQGNGEVAVLRELAGNDSGVPEQVRGVVRWVAQQLAPDHATVLASWPKTLRVQVDSLGQVLFCHATPRSETEVFTRLTPEDRLLPIFEPPGAPVVVCGHTHMQFDRTVGKVRVVNAGSVGMPFGQPGAYWLLLGPDIQLRRTTYDLAEAAMRIRRTEYPQAHDFADNNVLNPPSEKTALQLFSKADS